MVDMSEALESRVARLSGGRARPLPAGEDGRARLLLDVSGLSEHDAARLETQLVAGLGGAPLVVRTAQRATAPAGPKRIVAIASGKGGVGKSTVAAGIALALARRGLKVGLLDADIHGPSVPTLLGVAGRAQLKDKRIQPVEAQGIRALSMGWMADPDRAVAWRGPMASAAVAQMAAEALGCEPSRLDVVAGDTRENTDAGTTAASRVTYAVGLAVVAAARDLKGQVEAEAAKILGVPAVRVEWAGGIVRDRETGRYCPLAELAGQSAVPLRAASRLRMPYSERPAEGGLGHPHVLYSSNVQIAQVAVDVETGEVQVERVVAFPECGRVINRLGLEGQCEGGVAQGVGYALLEQVMLNDGRIINADLATYTIPTACDVPQVQTIPVEVPEATGPFGAKGAAENATLPTAPAILDAIADAIGVRFGSMPVTPERVVEALSARRET